jgi:hypothetical protein
MPQRHKGSQSKEYEGINLRIQAGRLVAKNILFEVDSIIIQ